MRPARKREKVRRTGENRIEPVKTGHDQGYWFYLHNCWWQLQRVRELRLSQQEPRPPHPAIVVHVLWFAHAHSLTQQDHRRDECYWQISVEIAGSSRHSSDGKTRRWWINNNQKILQICLMVVGASGPLTSCASLIVKRFGISQP